MKRQVLSSVLALAAATVACAACGKAPAKAPAGRSAASSASRRAPKNSDPDPCSLLPAEEVGAIMGKKVTASSSGVGSCEYGMDTTEKERQLEKMQGNSAGSASKSASSGDGNVSFDALTKAFASSGNGIPQMSQTMAEQLLVKLDIARDGVSEAELKGNYSATGSTVNRAVAPEKHGVQGTIAVAKDVPDVGDWAFTLNVAAVSMGPGFSSRGRLLEAREGPWHVTVGATISPDPGEAALDAKLAAIARTTFARLRAPGV